MGFLKDHNKITVWLGLIFFSLTSCYAAPAGAGELVLPQMPALGSRVEPSAVFVPAQLVGIRVDPLRPLELNFLVHHGDGRLSFEEKNIEYSRLVKYFLASLTVPEKDQWVNLSPYEQGRIIPGGLEETLMGRDLLIQDYLLKQLTASLMYPEHETGKAFWSNVYSQAAGTSSDARGALKIPVDMINKVWIVPDESIVYQHNNTACILKTHLKVLLETDYLAKKENDPAQSVMRKIIIPVLEKEVNEGKNFAALRQMVSGMVLATWYKKALRESVLAKGYADKSKVSGVGQPENGYLDKEFIYRQYIQAFKKGVYNYIKEEVDPVSKTLVSRKYFAGGFSRNERSTRIVSTISEEMLPLVRSLEFKKDSIDEAMVSLKSASKNSSAMHSRLTVLAKSITSPYRQLLDKFKGQLVASSLDEMTAQSFIDHHILKVVERAQHSRDKQRLLFGFSGTFAGGKTTVAELVARTLEQGRVPWRVKTFSFDDFLKDKEDREPWDTEDPSLKFDVKRFVQFVKDLSINKEARKPIYDQKSKGQLKFGLDEQGQITVFAGQEELLLTVDGKTVAIQKFAVSRSLEGARLERIRVLEKHEADAQRTAEIFLGSTPVKVGIILLDNGLKLRVRIKDQDFIFQDLGQGWMLAGTEELLSREHRIEALETWDPVRSRGERDIIIAEGILALTASEYFDVSANINVSARVRRARGMARELARGHEGGSKYAETVYQRGYDEDLQVDGLNAAARKERGFGAREQKHFQVNDMSLPELMFRLAVYEQKTPKMVRDFMEEGLNLENIIQEIQGYGRRSRLQWVKDRGRGPFKDLSIGQQGVLSTIILGEYVLMKTVLGESGTVGQLTAQMQQRFSRLLERTQGLLSGASLINFKEKYPYIDIVAQRAFYMPDLYRGAAIKSAMLINQLPLMRDVVAGRVAAGIDRGNKGFWIDNFFDVQRRLVLRGIIDARPSFALHYGLGFYHGQGVVLGLDPEAYALDQDAVDAVTKIAAMEDHSVFMKGLIDKYQLEGLPVELLKGFQKRFIGDTETSEDYLSLIPVELRRHYIEQALGMPRDLRDLQLMGFRRDMEDVSAVVSAGFKNEGVAIIDVDAHQIESAAEVMAQYGLGRIKEDFFRYKKEQGKKLDISGGTYQQLWVLSYRLSLQENFFDFHYAMIDALGRILLNDPQWLDGKTAEEAYAGILETLVVEREGKIPSQSPWMKGTILGAIHIALKLSSSRNDADQAMLNGGGAGNRVSVSNKEDALAEAPGGIDLNPARMGMQINRSGMDIHMNMDTVILRRLQEQSGFIPVIIDIKPLMDLKLL